MEGSEFYRKGQYYLSTQLNEKAIKILLVVASKKVDPEEPILKRLIEVAYELEEERQKEGEHRNFGEWWLSDGEIIKIKERQKFWALDQGSSGHFLIDKTTGEIFNLASAYGRPDHNKKQKADLGNIKDATGEFLYPRRWNYLR